MNPLMITIYIILILIVIILLLYSHFKNKYNEVIIKITEAENRIESLLKEKYDNIDKEATLSKDIIKIDEKFINDVMKLRSKKLNNFEYENKLIELNKNFRQIYEDNKKLKDNKEIISIIKDIQNIDEALIAIKNYYNQNTKTYNKMIHKIPTNIIAKIKKYQSKTIFDI